MCDLAAVCVQARPRVESLSSLQNDPVQETALQGHADREHAQAERLSPGGRLQLVLLNPQFAIERMQAAGHPASGQEAPMRNRLIGEAQRNIDERFVLDIRQAV